MKRLFIVLTVMCLVFSGCGGQSSAPAKSSAPAVSSTPAQSSAPAASTSAPGKTFKISLGDSGSDKTANYAAATAFKQYVDANSGGQITVGIFHNGQLGNDRELIEGVQMGQVTCMGTSTGQHVNFHPQLGVFDAPFAFNNKDDVYALFKDANFSAAMQNMFKAKGFRLMGMYVQGFRTLTSNKEVHSPADCKNLNIRTMENKNQMAVWRALGANPTPISFTELYTALQQGVVSAQENPIDLIYSQKFYEQQKFIIDTNHQAQIILFVMNGAFYDSLPDNLKTVVTEGAKKAMEAGQAFVNNNEAKFIEEIKAKGVKFINLSGSEKQQFKDATAGVWDSVAKEQPEFFKIYKAALDSTQKK